MQAFTIKDIENLTGIKAHTLRIWEQRYSFFQPKRKESQHRIYDNDDLKRLLRIAFLYHNGWKVSKIAALSEEEITAVVASAPSNGSSHGGYVTRLIEAMLDFNEHEFLTTLNEIIQKIGFEQCVVQVCYPYLVKLGNLWTTNHAIPAQEHFSSYLIQNRVIVETDRLPLSQEKPEIILLCPQGDFHELPLLFLNYLMRKAGWSTLYLGTNITLTELTDIVATTGARYLYLHFITNFTGFEVDDYLEKICTSFRNHTIVVSGEGAIRCQRNFTNAILLRNDANIYRFVHRQPPI